MIPKRRLKNKGMEFFTRMERISPLSTVGGVEVVSIHCILLSECSLLSLAFFFFFFGGGGGGGGGGGIENAFWWWGIFGYIWQRRISYF